MKTVFALLASVLAAKYDNFHLVQINVENKDLSWIEDVLNPFDSIGLWEDIEEDTNEIRFTISPDEFQILKIVLENHKLGYNVIRDNVQSLIDADLKKRAERGSNPAEFSYEEYLDYDEYQAWLDEMVSQYGGDQGTITKSFSFGTSHYGRQIYGYVLHGPDPSWENSGKPGILIDCGIHSREWISPASCRLFIYELLRCVPDANGAAPSDCALDANEFMEFNWFIIPILNPDGYVYTWTDDRAWRKNLFQGENPLCTGVDLNRNSDVAFGTQGSSDNPCSNSYHGVAATSEPEMKAWNNAGDLAMFISDIKAYVGVHSYSQQLASPYAISYDVFPDEPKTLDLIEAAGKQMSEAMTAVHGKKYIYGQSRVIRSLAAGTTKDYMHEKRGIPLSWTMELRDTGEYGFLLPADQILPTFDEFLVGFKELIRFINANNI